MIGVRKASAEDEDFLYRIRSQPSVSEMSLSAPPESREKHHRWLNNKLHDPNCAIYIIKLITPDINDCVGYIRFDSMQLNHVVSVAVDEKYRGYGYAFDGMYAAITDFLHKHFKGRIRAYIKPDNKASIKLFKKLAFKKYGKDTVEGQEVLVYVF